MINIRTLIVFLACWMQFQAHAFVLPSGIDIYPDESLDLTYQVVESYDTQEKVIAGWNGDQLRYFVTTEKMPPGWLDHKKWFASIVQEMRKSGKSIRSTKEGEYKTTSSLVGNYLDIRYEPSQKDKLSGQIFHFLSDGKTAFIAIATPATDGAIEAMIEETKLIFKSTKIASETPAKITDPNPENQLTGHWRWSGQAPDGRTASLTMKLGEDRSFNAEVAIDGVVGFRGEGKWSIDDRRLLWSYERSEPTLPANKREDEDLIVGIESSRLVLKSKLSGMERVFIRQ